MSTAATVTAVKILRHELNASASQNPSDGTKACRVVLLNVGARALSRHRTIPPSMYEQEALTQSWSSSEKAAVYATALEANLDFDLFDQLMALMFQPLASMILQVCQTALQNLELNGFFHFQFQGTVASGKFSSDQRGDFPLGMSVVNPTGLCPASMTPVPDSEQLQSLVTSPGTHIGGGSGSTGAAATSSSNATTAADDATAMDAVANDSTTSTDDDTATATSTAAGSATPAPAAALAGAHLSNGQEAPKLNAQFRYGNHDSGMAAIENALKVTEAKLQQFLSLCWVKYVKAKTEPPAVCTNCRRLEKTHLGDIASVIGEAWAVEYTYIINTEAILKLRALSLNYSDVLTDHVQLELTLDDIKWAI
ncbi:hypothetical protein K439DRAFT_1614538, partial [Ramaria rubella]